ncbi:hypothetical protein PK98_15390 [Croceibacterium mercuriale]|uniref:DUF4268 domain-containing protein n=1 Tax=Croceibacterium mercuriale TaxID=1572751 RepID=A0A0B2BWY8_9SPHN|nr:hypothetical protein [Croceibacterium mercuriale]KHL24153.1 hypothetical protein PK98_15390 [Croceibacterium mercuriale]
MDEVVKMEKPAAAARQAFWSMYEDRDPASADDRKMAGATVRWRAVPDTRMVVSRFTQESGVGLFLRGTWGQKVATIAHRLRAADDQLSADLGTGLGDPDHPYTTLLPVDWTDAEAVTAAIEWLVRRTDDYADAVAKHLRADGPGRSPDQQSYVRI